MEYNETRMKPSHVDEWSFRYSLTSKLKNRTQVFLYSKKVLENQLEMGNKELILY